MFIEKIALRFTFHHFNYDLMQFIVDSKMTVSFSTTHPAKHLVKSHNLFYQTPNLNLTIICIGSAGFLWLEIKCNKGLQPCCVYTMLIMNFIFSVCCKTQIIWRIMQENNIRGNMLSRLVWNYETHVRAAMAKYLCESPLESIRYIVFSMKNKKKSNWNNSLMILYAVYLFIYFDALYNKVKNVK